MRDVLWDIAIGSSVLADSASFINRISWNHNHNGVEGTSKIINIEATEMILTYLEASEHAL